MSTHKVEVVIIDKVDAHPNADRLELATIAGWNCVIGKGQFKTGDKAIYVPIDSILPEPLENLLFPPDSKIKLERHRVKTIKLRGAISQGLLVDPAEVGLQFCKVGEDVAAALGITKFEPAAQTTPTGMRGNQMPRKGVNSAFRKYTDIENFKHYNRLFTEGEEVYVTEKLHGTSARYGWLPTEANTFWKRIKKLFGLLPRYEWVIGSRNVQLQDRKYDGFYSENVYGKIAAQEELMDRIDPDEVVYGEIVGAGIQKGYTYGCGENEHKFFAYDVIINGKYLDVPQFLDYCIERGITPVPFLYSGPYNEEVILAMREGDSLVGGQKVREGIVIKSVTEQTCMVGRKVLKAISDTYLLKNVDGTDFH